MEDNIFKPLTHMDREGYDENLKSRFQRRDTTPFEGSAFENMDSDPVNPQEGWEPDTEIEKSIAQNDIEASGCMCPTEIDDEDNVVYSETIVVEFYDNEK